MIPLIPFCAEIQRIRETIETVAEDRIACNPLKNRVLSRKCRIHRHLLEMAVVESLPLRQTFSFRYLQYVTTN